MLAGASCCRARVLYDFEQECSCLASTPRTRSALARGTGRGAHRSRCRGGAALKRASEGNNSRLVARRRSATASTPPPLVADSSPPATRPASVAPLPRLTAGTLLSRVLDPVTVKDVLGHDDLKTTERDLHAVQASRLSDPATRAPSRLSHRTHCTPRRSRDRVPVNARPRAARRPHARAAELRGRAPARFAPAVEGPQPPVDHLRLSRPSDDRSRRGPADPLPAGRPCRTRGPRATVTEG